ncbi:Fur family transcriptional regulator [Nocardia noduli]|uniref:Fur family transcriptional regulator n=1 Tax=Nocardia noduli TaxID=2815722 RepID=UPI0020B2D3D5|nr:transcriptional repressor [Nocardia noduli]
MTPRLRDANAPARRAQRARWQSSVLAALKRDDHFRSAQQLHLDLHTTFATSIALTTVYRILRRLTTQQIVETQRAENDELLYRIRDDSGHHHYLLCRTCGRAERFAVEPFERRIDSFASAHGYADIDHRIDIYGTCAECHAGSSRPTKT